MTTLSFLADLPEETPVAIILGSGPYTIADLRAAIAAGGTVEITTQQASDTFSRSPETWATLARNGLIEGAYQDGDGGPWRLPLRSCEEYIERQRQNRSVPRGPRTPSARVGTEGLPERKVLPSRPAALERRSLDDAQPRGPRMARAGREDRAS